MASVRPTNTNRNSRVWAQEQERLGCRVMTRLLSACVSLITMSTFTREARDLDAPLARVPAKVCGEADTGHYNETLPSHNFITFQRAAATATLIRSAQVAGRPGSDSNRADPDHIA